jgi:DNA segregation ATPase FtsK/SpoIIIE, S-DNA-T family
MAARGGNKATGGRKPATGKPTTRARAPRRGARTEARPALLRPEHQRDLFALGLITIALVTIIFFATGIAGGIGEFYVAVVRQAFGVGAVVVPVTLGLLGVAILIQEQFRDSRLSAANLAGTLLIIGAILGLLEMPAHAIAPELRGDEGGGLIGFWVVQLLDQAIGRPAATLVVIVLGLVGVLLTFNVTLRELLAGSAERGAAFWALLWSGPRASARPQRPALADSDLPFSPPPQGADDDLIPTPIAARPTRASLFQRPGAAPEPPVPSKVVPPAPPKAAPAPPAKEAAPPPLPSRPPIAVGEPPREVVQEALDGFAAASIHRA